LYIRCVFQKENNVTCIIRFCLHSVQRFLQIFGLRGTTLAWAERNNIAKKNLRKPY